MYNELAKKYGQIPHSLVSEVDSQYWLEIQMPHISISGHTKEEALQLSRAFSAINKGETGREVRDLIQNVIGKYDVSIPFTTPMTTTIYQNGDATVLAIRIKVR